MKESARDSKFQAKDQCTGTRRVGGAIRDGQVAKSSWRMKNDGKYRKLRKQLLDKNPF